MPAISEPTVEVGQTWEHLKSGARVLFISDSEMGPDYILGRYLDDGSEKTFHRPTVLQLYRGIEQT